jgi:prevent-host-death family protein
VEATPVSITTLSSREFQQNASHAQKAAQDGPVFITSRGKPVNVLLSIEEYRRITGKKQNIADLLYMPGAEDIEFEIPKLDELPRPADFS